MQLAGAIETAKGADLFRAEHLTHLRCEIPSADLLDTVRDFTARYPVGLISLMDHTPGQRQFRDIEKYYTYATRGGRSLAEIQANTALKIRDGQAFNAVNRPALVALAREHGIALASHDDTTPADVAMAKGEGVQLAEFPTTLEAAQASPRRRHHRDDGGAQPDPRRFAFRQRRGRGPGAGRPARRALLRLRPGKPGDGGVRAA